MNRPKSRLSRQTTTTTLVTNLLRAVDDFVAFNQLVRMTGRNVNQVSAALHHLKQHKVVDCVIHPNGQLWWFALPPHDDNRCRTVNEWPVGVTKRAVRRVTKRS